ncbi:MAG TPA: alpha/beta fold hydrolase [Solirubrobacteraceae bacterium]|nr:alpha/beta fold hydrolase [Solirubrobacteraceae bacterium]
MSTTQIRFTTAADGARLAYAMHGSGPPLVRVATWLTHLESDWDSPIWSHWLRRLGETHTVLRYDERGCGLSDSGVGELSVDTWVTDLEAVVDAAGLERFDLLGVSQGAAIAVAYAARHPRRVAGLVLYGGYARGRRVRGQQEQEDALVAAIRAGWTTDDPAFRHVFSMLFLPHASPEQMAWYDELLRASTTVDSAVALFTARGAVDVVENAAAVKAPTLVMHARGDHVVPVQEGRLLAKLIPNARLVLLDSENHILLADEPTWEQFLSALRGFLGVPASRAPGLTAGELSARELDVLELVANGLTNDAIAERLFISARTVERHLSNIYAKLRLSGKSARAGAAVAFIGLRKPSGPRRG